MIADLKKDAEQRMGKAVVAFQQGLKKMRTGRAHTSLLEHIHVDYYGTRVPLNQTANVAVEDARTLSVTPWEHKMVQVIEKAIMSSDLGLTPVTAGSVIRVPLPPLTEERRRDLARHINREAEQARVAVRNVRRDVMNDLKELLKEREITEDDERKAELDVQEMTDRYVGQIDRMSEDKQKEIMHV
ncbi:MAG: ribosome recycling factor [Gammaproteobacteria bacterium]|nr:ribosome recycling factor [Gammaproteobacteria bacterium]